MSPTPSLRRKDKTLRRSDASFKRSPEPNAARCRTLRRSPVPQPNVSPSFSYVSDSEPSYALSDASFSPSPKAEFRQNISQMPVELWAMVADFASRSSVACLCGVSRHFHTLFLPTLYRNTIHPPLTAAQTALFLQTLASKKPASGQPHPALLVRELGLVDTVGSEIILDSSTISKALKRLHLAEGLRTLEWTLAAGVDDLGKIFGAPGRFPHLRELVVSCKGKNNNFNFAQIPGLEVLELHINLAELMDMYDIGAKAIYKLSQALGMLASSSPHLHTLGLNLKIPFFNDEFPDNAYTDLIATVNSIYLPLLGNVDFSFDFSPDICYYDGFGPPELPKTDLSLFLSNHPNLTHLALHTHSTNLTEVDALMPRLRCFCGSFRDASVLCAGSRQLRSLVLALLYFDFLDFMPSFELVPLPPHGSLTHIRVCVAEADGKIIKMPEELSPRSLQQIVTAFPSLTHLDVVISRRMNEYLDTLVLLSSLQKLSIREYRTRRIGPPNWPAVLVFPAEDYIQELSTLLPSLTKLAGIEIHLLGDTYPDSDDFELFDYMYEPAQMTIHYRFSILRDSSGGARVVLDSTRVDDSYSRSS